MLYLISLQEKHRMLRQLESFQDAMADMKATLASTSADKERFFQEKLDLHQQLQNAKYEKESFQKVSDFTGYKKHVHSIRANCDKSIIASEIIITYLQMAYNFQFTW